jgi:hypothetical protein
MQAQRPPDLPSKDDAERIGRRLLGDLGVDLDHAAVRVDDSITLWNVVVDPIVGGLPTVGLTSSVGIGPKGVVQYANGWLGTPTKGDRYPLIGTAAGLDRLNKEQTQLMMIAPEVQCLECPATTAAEPRVVRVTGARLGLQVFSTFEPGADGYLVPTYLFSTEDGGELPVVAVADQYLGQTPRAEEPDHGTPAEPSGTGSCSGSAAGSGSSGPASTSVTQSEVQVCVSDPVLAGRSATFTITGKGNLRDDCGSPVPEWGDGDEVAVCDIGCESLPREPREISKTFEHSYAKAGTYTAVFHFMGCGADSGTDQSSVSLEVRVGT